MTLTLTLTDRLYAVRVRDMMYVCTDARCTHTHTHTRQAVLGTWHLVRLLTTCILLFHYYYIDCDTTYILLTFLLQVILQLGTQLCIRRPTANKFISTKNDHTIIHAHVMCEYVQITREQQARINRAASRIRASLSAGRAQSSFLMPSLSPNPK